MRTKLIAIAVASLFANGSAWGADDNFIWNGSIELGGRGVNSDGVQRNGAYGSFPSATVTPFAGPKDGAKAQEYQDVDNGVIGVIDMRGSNRDYYLKFFGENFGRDDQFIDARGGGYGVFKAQVYSDRMPHNFSFNALSPLANPTSTLQTGPGGAYPQAQNPAAWNLFDYGIQRNTTGGNIEVSAKSPFFVRADYNEVVTTGTRPGGAQLGTGSGNGMIELGVPVEYKTKNATIEAGYTAKTWNVKLGYLDSRFSNGIGSFQWTNFYMNSALDTSLLPQDNELQKWSLNFSARELPLDSTLVVRVTQSKLTDSFAVAGGGLKPTGNQSPPTGVGILVTTPDPGTFDGEHKTTSVAVALASMPMKGLDTRLYYNYYDKENNSTPIEYAGGGLGTAAATCPGVPPSNTATRFCIAANESEQFAYKKNEVGLDLTYRIDKQQKLVGGYNYLKVDRNLDIAEETTNNRFWIEYRNRMVESLDGRLKYQYLQRRSDIDHLHTASGPAVPGTVPYYYSQYDFSNFDQNMVKLTVDWSPAPMLDIGIGARYAKTDYKDLQYYGRSEDTRQNYDLTIAYGDPDNFRIMGIGNWGAVKFDQGYRNVGSATATPPNNLGPLPTDPTNSANFNWGTRNTQDNWMVAVQADWVATEQLSVTARASWLNTSGGVDFTSDNTQAAGGFNGGPLVNYVTDNTKTQRFLIKADYKINKNWMATIGYAYENYEYTDDQMRSYQSYYPYYQYLPGATPTPPTTNNSWLTGAFANPGYTNNIFYLTATYKFN